MTTRNYYNRFRDAGRTDLLSITGVARLYNVTPAAVSNWVSRYESFPEPEVIDGSGSVALWSRTAVQEWHVETLGKNARSIAKRK